MIHEADIGAVAATVLAQGGHRGETLTLTGPAVLTPIEMVPTIGKVISRDLQRIELSEAQAPE